MSHQQDWEFLAASSEHQTAIAIQQLLHKGEVMEASVGLDVLIESIGKSKKLALTSQLTRLMAHMIKWKCQPEQRSSSWSITIRSARQEILDIQEEVPSLNRDFIESIWDKCFNTVKDAEDEMGKKSELTVLSWQEVVEERYSLLPE